MGEEIVKVRARRKPKGCMDCPFRHYVPGEEDEYDICGLTGEDIPWRVNASEPEYHMEECPIVWDERCGCMGCEHERYDEDEGRAYCERCGWKRIDVEDPEKERPAWCPA